MKIATCELRSVSPYSQSRFHNTPKLMDKSQNVTESADDYEKRTWRNRCHVTDDGHIFIPPMAFSNAIKEAAQFLSIKIQGKGNATWTKHFDAGILVTDGLVLPETKDSQVGEWIYVNADGRRGSGKRVMRCYPVIPKWAGKVDFIVLDDRITEPVFRQHLAAAGQLIGLGRFRPRNRGYFGRFDVVSVKWKDGGAGLLAPADEEVAETA